MDLSDLIASKRVVPHLKANCKRRALEALAEFAAKDLGVNAVHVHERLMERERLGSTGVGGGVAIPHGKIDGLKNLYGVFARLDLPVNFDAVDDEPVDIIFLLLTPEDAGADHLKALAQVSRCLRDKTVCDSIRGAESADAIYAILTAKERSNAA